MTPEDNMNQYKFMKRVNLVTYSAIIVIERKSLD